MTKGMKATWGTMLVLILPVAAHASLVTYQATGTVSSTFGPTQELPAPIASAVVGESVSLDWTVNTDTPVSGSIPGEEAQYSGALTALSARVGSSLVNVDLSTGTNAVVIDDNFLINPAAQTYETGYTINRLSSAYDIYLGTSFAGQSMQNLYSSTSLSNAPLSPAVANTTHDIEFAVSNSAGVYVNIDTISAVPLPPTVWLLLSGVGLVLAARDVKRLRPYFRNLRIRSSQSGGNSIFFAVGNPR